MTDPYVTDARLDDLLRLIRGTDGFANYVILRNELASLLIEIKCARNQPLRCPCCDGDHP